MSQLIRCTDSKTTFLLTDDPTEHFDLASTQKSKVKELWKVLQKYYQKAVKPFHPKPDPAGSPKYWGGVYSPGWCKAEVKRPHISKS